MTTSQIIDQKELEEKLRQDGEDDIDTLNQERKVTG